MIKLSKVNKYFHYKKNNEIHVIKDVSLNLPKTGLVCLLGPSGSGKTTLLNIISGLDNAENGVIEIDGITLDKYDNKAWTELRSKKFGYIFQNYLLLPDLTVYENLEFVLKGFNLCKDKISERINYSLNAVGMDKFKYRKASELSGGQQQRVSIARALVKSPDVYIADEPTGNLDEENTTIIMNILKKISKQSLIVLVTHERRIADFYADRIIELKDGVIISDNENIGYKNLQRYDDSNLYLKEYKKTSHKIKDLHVDYFYKTKDKDKAININIIYDNGYYFIESKDKDRVKFLDTESEIKIIDSKQPVLEIDDLDKVDFELANIETSKKISNFDNKEIFNQAIKNIKNMKLIHKIMIMIFFLTSIFFTYSFTNYNSSRFVDENLFLFYNRDLVEIDTSNSRNIDEINKIRATVDVDYLFPHHRYLNIPYLTINEFYQKRESATIENYSVYPLDQIYEIDLVMGEIPNGPLELAIDLSLANKLLKTSSFRSLGVNQLNQLLGLTYQNNFGIYRIVGIIDNNNPNFYISAEGFKLLALNRILNHFVNANYILYDSIVPIDYNLYNLNLEKTNNLKDLNLANDEILVSKSLYDMLSQTKINVGKKEYEVVGNYNYNNGNELSIYLQKHHLDEFYLNSLIYFDSLYFISSNKEYDIKRLQTENIQSQDLYNVDYIDNLVLEKDNMSLLYSFIIIVLSLLFLYFIMRSSVNQRVYTLGVYRSLGVSKYDILKIFLIEILLISFMSAFVGILCFSLVILKLNNVANFIYLPWYVPVSSFGFILISNLVIGLIPVNRLLKKTPAFILSRYDL